MIYFSEILHKAVYTDHKTYLGKLKDLIFVVKEKPYVTKMVIHGDKDIILPLSALKSINGKIIVSENAQHTQLEENELYIHKNILDKQIIDIGGSKVVRVNDVVIQNKPEWYVSGVDISLYGVLRWFGLEKIAYSMLNKLFFTPTPEILSLSDIQPLELARGRIQLKLEQNKLKKLRPEDLADYLELTNTESIKNILNTMDQDYAADVIKNLKINYQTELFNQFTSEKAASIISKIEPDDAVDILLTLDSRIRKDILEHLHKDDRIGIDHLLEHSHTPIGEHMTTEYYTAFPNATVKQVMKEIRSKTNEFEHLNYVYILNNNEQLVGVCNLHELLTYSDDTPLYKFMITDVIAINLSTPEEIAISKMLKYKLYSIPVIDREKHLLGIITLDAITGFLLEKFT
jgi:CBS domain-containing protein/sporulation protein YlmC with PRC-barrel domain